MSMIDLGSAFADYEGPQIANEGMYDLRVASVKATMPKDDQPTNGDPKGWTLMVVFEDDGYLPMNHWLPNTGHPANEHWQDIAVRNLKGFFKLFGYDVEQEFNPEDLVGLTANQATVLVKENEYNGETQTQNSIKIPMV